jgi:hypothetical protein
MQRKLTSIRTLSIIAIALLSGMKTTGADFEFTLGGGLLASPDYKDLIDEAYDDYDVWGGYGWLDLTATGSIIVNDRFSYAGYVDWMFNFGAGDESFFNSVVIPGISTRYRFSENPSSGFLEAGIGYPIPSTDSDRFDFDSDGVSLRGEIGYEFSSNWEISLGYRYVPIEVELDSWDWWGDGSTEVRSEDLGGIFLEFGFRF